VIIRAQSARMIIFLAEISDFQGIDEISRVRNVIEMPHFAHPFCERFMRKA
jgi:hypothetical protein